MIHVFINIIINNKYILKALPFSFEIMEHNLKANFQILYLCTCNNNRNLCLAFLNENKVSHSNNYNSIMHISIEN